MRKFHIGLLILTLILAAPARATNGGSPSSYTGTVVDDQGRPVAGATVECYVDSSPVAFYTAQDFALKERGSTDSKGAFTVPIGAGVTLVVVKKEGLAPGWRTFASVLDQSSDPVVLSALATPARSEVDANGQLISYSAPVSYALVGRVVDENGRPVADAEVWVTMAMPVPGGGLPPPVFQPGADQLGAIVMPALPGGEFSQRSMIFGKPARDCFSARTGADGRFRIANFPGNTQANLAAHKSGMALSVPANVGGGGIVGFGMRRVNNRAAIGTPPPYMPGQQVNLAAGSLQHDLMPYTSGQLNIELTLKQAGSIEGKVIVEETDQPLAGVKLIPLTSGRGLSGLQMPESVLSGADGSFRIANLVPGAMAMAAVFPGDLVADWTAQEVTVTVVAGETLKNVQVRALRCRITGTVRDPSGRPVAGATLSVAPGAGKRLEVLTDSAGRYEASWPAAIAALQEVLTLLVRDADRHLVATREVDASTTNFDLNLVPSVTLIAKVKDPSGNPVTNATASLSWRRGDKSGTQGAGTSDAQGRIEFGDMPPEDDYSISVSANGFGPGSQNVPLPLRQALRLEFPTVVLRPANQKLAGQVWGPDGKPVAGATVSFRGEGQPGGQANSDGTGHFSFATACEGPLVVSASTQRAGGGYHYSGDLNTQGGDTNVLIHFVANGQAGGSRVATTFGRVLDPSGTPLSEALISVLPVNGIGVDLRSDADGKFTIVWRNNAGTPNGEIPFINALDPDRHLALAQDLDEKTTNMDLRLEPSLTLSVKVQETTGTPIRGATANLFSYAGRLNIHIAGPVGINDQGVIEFKDLPPGRPYTAMIGAPGYGSTRIEANAEETRTNHFELPTVVFKLGDRKLAGQVVDANGKPIAKANVSFSGTGQLNAQKSTDDTGHFAFDAVHEGPVQLHARSQTVSGSYMDSSIQATGGDTNVVIRLGVLIRGTVFDAAGKPAAGVPVRLWGDAWHRNEVNTGPDGRYSIIWEKQQGNGAAPLIFARDVERNLAASEDINETNTNHDLTLQPGLTLSVKMQDVNGQPISKATGDLTVWRRLPELQFNHVRYEADERGVIEISDLSPGWNYRMDIDAKGYRSVTLTARASDTKANRFDFPTVVLKIPDRKLAGQVLDSDGKPIPGAEVIINGESQPNAGGNTDFQGRFAFEGLCEGPVQVRATLHNVLGMNDTAQAQSEAGDTNVVVRFKPPGLVVTNSGTVLDPSGAPVAGVRPLVVSGYFRETASDANGKYSILWMSPAAAGKPQTNAAYQFLLVGRDVARGLASAVEIEEKTTKVDLRLEKALTISGSLRGPKGEPVTNGVMFLRIGRSHDSFVQQQYTPTDAQGEFCISNLPPGQIYSVTANAIGYGRNEVPVPAEETKTASLRLPPIIIQVADQKLAGRVVDAKGTAIEGARIELSGVNQRTSYSTTDSEGRFIFNQVCEGPLTVMANSNDIQARVPAQGGDTNVVINLGL